MICDACQQAAPVKPERHEAAALQHTHQHGIRQQSRGAAQQPLHHGPLAGPEVPNHLHVRRQSRWAAPRRGLGTSSGTAVASATVSLGWCDTAAHLLVRQELQGGPERLAGLPQEPLHLVQRDDDVLQPVLCDAWNPQKILPGRHASRWEGTCLLGRLEQNCTCSAMTILCARCSIITGTYMSGIRHRRALARHLADSTCSNTTSSLDDG